MLAIVYGIAHAVLFLIGSMFIFSRRDLLHPLLDAVTTLDPRFDAAYRFGAIFLAEPYPDGAGRPEPAVKPLKKGVRARPERWQYPPSVEPGAAARR